MLLLPRPRLPAWLGRVAGALALIVAPTRPALALPLNPLDWTAEPFLKLYVTLGAGVLIIALIARHMLRLGRPPGPVDRLDVIDLAYLAGGVRRAADTVVVGMLAAGALRYEVPSGHITIADRGAPLPPHLEPFRHTIDGGGRGTVTRSLRQRLESVRQGLVQAGLAPTPERLRIITVTILLLMMPVVAFGLAKISVGFERGKPVGILVMLTAAAALFGAGIASNRPIRTGGGDVVLDRYRQRHQRVLRAPRSETDEVLLGFALAGAAALAGTPYAAYGRAATSSGGGCGSSGGDGSGGGGGCGGCGGGCGS